MAVCLHEEKACPRCGDPFICKPGCVTECQCFGKVLTEDMQLLLAQRYHDCLCGKCLDHLRQEPHLFAEKYLHGNK